ncbi:MAG: molybdopterin molybdotransferase MoeA [Bacteroidales bacterium]|nr:molybdopterin molybdotransferase MoeA [Bacteroidales bacterium]
MISFEEAISKILENCSVIEYSEEVKFSDSLNRVLFEDVIVNEDVPSFNRSAVDGYATKRSFINKPLKIVGTISAGNILDYNINEGECLKVMTGSYLPECIDYVAKVEDTEIDERGFIIIKKVEDKSNIRFKGEDIKANNILLQKGTLIEPQHVAMLASIGKNVVKVYKPISVAIISTGDEIVEPYITPAFGKIRNSNAYQLLMQCKQISINADYLGIIPDNFDDVFHAIKKVEKQFNAIIITGGVSKGDYDYVHRVIKELNFEILFHYVLVQPGHPSLAAKTGNTMIFALPGNPVSSYFQFECFVKPALLKMMGHTFKPKIIYAKLGSDFRRKQTNRTVLHPIKLVDGFVYPIEYHGSAHLFSLKDADGFVIISPYVTTLTKGDDVLVRLF